MGSILSLLISRLSGFVSITFEPLDETEKISPVSDSHILARATALEISRRLDKKHTNKFYFVALGVIAQLIISGVAMGSTYNEILRAQPHVGKP